MKIITSILSIVLFSMGVYAQTNILSLDYQQHNNNQIPNRIIQDKGVQGLSVEYQFPTASYGKIQEGSEVFQLMKIKGFSHLQQVGLPALPAHIDMVVVPKGASYTIKSTSSTKIMHKSFRIYPAKKPAQDTEGEPEPEFEMNKEFYASNQTFPAKNIKVIETIKMRGVDILLIQVCPIQYNPAKSEIYTANNIKYTIEFNGGDHFLNYENHSQTFLQEFTNFPLNREGILQDIKGYKIKSNTKTQTGNGSKNYIIITQNTMLAAADSLANWKRQMGYSVEVISQASWTSTQVKTAIQSRYANWSPKPDFYVIIGDVQQVPTETFYTPDGADAFGSDLYYACMDGGSDYVPDMGRGRISVSSTSEANAVVQKIIKYERNPIYDTSFYKNGLNCAQFQDDDHDGYADRRFTHTSEDVRDYMLNQNYNVQRIYYTDNAVMPYNYNASYYSNGQSIPTDMLKTNGFAWTGGATNIKNAINAGRFYVLHRDHGYTGGSGWAHPYFTTSSIPQLSNGDKLPVVFSINCHTGEFTLPNCFAEKFLRHSNGGTVGIIAASYYSYSGYNDGFAAGMFDGIWSNPGLIPVFGTGGNANPSVTAHSDITQMGLVMDHGLIRMTQTWGGGSNARIYSYRLFHYFGDPSMRIWTKQPDSISATHALSINCTDTTFIVSNINDSNAIVTLTGGNTLLGKASVQNGTAVIPVSGIVGAQLTLTITSRDRIPYITKIQVNSGGSLAVYANIKPIVCYGDSNGYIRVKTACGQPPYNYSWAHGPMVENLDSLGAGQYILTVSDSLNQSITDTFSVYGPSSAMQINPVIKNARCYFEASGEVNLNLQGGNPPYVIQWSNGWTSTTATNLAAGNYSVSIKDSLGCILQNNFEILQPSPLDLNATSQDDLTNNCSGKGIATISGGIPPYTYLWNDPAQQTTPTAQNLCKGIYKITVKDSNLCTTYRTIYVNNTVGISEINNPNQIVVYPNPATEQISISWKENKIQRIEILDATAKTIFVKNVASNSNQNTQINVKQWADGFYTLRFIGENHLSTNKLLIISK